MTAPKPLAPQAIFFDFDGVILDTVPMKAQAFTEVLADDIPADQMDAVMHYYHANGGTSRLKKLEEIWRDFIHQPLDDATKSRLGQAFSAMVTRKVAECAFVEGTEEFLKAYSSKIPCFVISGTPQPELREVVESRGLTGYFAGVYGSPDTKAVIGRRLLDAHDFEARRVYFVGDATTDRDAADALGMPFVGLTGPHLSPFVRGDEIMVDDLHPLAEILGLSADS